MKKKKQSQIPWIFLKNPSNCFYCKNKTVFAIKNFELKGTRSLLLIHQAQIKVCQEKPNSVC